MLPLARRRIRRREKWGEQIEVRSKRKSRHSTATSQWMARRKNEIQTIGGDRMVGSLRVVVLLPFWSTSYKRGGNHTTTLRWRDIGAVKGRRGREPKRTWKPEMKKNGLVKKHSYNLAKWWQVVKEDVLNRAKFISIMYYTICTICGGCLTRRP